LRCFFYISYNGAEYHGWQRQNNALGVQQVMEDAIGQILNTAVEITGSGRTDKGVHALEQVFHLDIPHVLAPDQVKYSLNGVLPADIVVNDIRKVRDNAHARYDAIRREYEYRVHFVKSPFNRGFSSFQPVIPDIEKMNHAANLLKGEHDFTSFSKVKTDVKHFICQVDKAEWRCSDDGKSATFLISANRFLRGMVRAVTGTLLLIGQGKLSADELVKIIDAKNRSLAGESVPPYGLYLWSIIYPESIFKKD